MFVRNAEIHSVTRQELSEAGLIGIPGPVQALRERLAWLPFAELPGTTLSARMELLKRHGEGSPPTSVRSETRPSSTR